MNKNHYKMIDITYLDKKLQNKNQYCKIDALIYKTKYIP